jgi:phage/plasmid-like protein (TIGR03299 family)
MSHEISITRNGVAEAAFALLPAWHGLGEVTAEPVTVEELFNLAGLGWEVESVPAMTDFNGTMIPVPGVKAIRRCDNGFVTGIVSKKYREFQNVELLNIAREVFGRAKVGESAFALFGGAKVVLVINLGRDTVKVGKVEDPHDTYLFLSTGHDGESPITAFGSDVRGVCNNTFTLALNEADGAGKTVKIRHSSKHSERVADLVEALRAIRTGHEAHFGMLRKLAKAKLNKDQRSTFFGKVVDAVLPPIVTPANVTIDMVLAASEADQKTSLRDRRRDDLLNDILGMYDWEVKTNRMAPDSAYTAFQSVSDVIEHVVVNPRGTDLQRAENRFESRTSGKAADLKTTAMSLLDEILAAA